MVASSIQWTQGMEGRVGRSDWNPVRGCTRVSPGCGGPGPHGGCYAEAIASRFSGPGLAFEGFATRANGNPHWTGRVEVMWDRLTDPLKWRKPATIFALSMSDLFHEKLPMEEIATIYGVMVAAAHLRGHRLQVLTKRSERMRAMLNDPAFWDQVNAEASMHVVDGTDPLNRRTDDARATLGEYGLDNPPPGIWLGVSVEDRERLPRIDDLRATPAAIRFLSLEPLLEDLGRINLTGIDQAIIGGESGPRARRCWVPDVRSIVRQCRRAGVAVFVKQLGANVQDRNDAGFDGCEPAGWPDMDPLDIDLEPEQYVNNYQGAPCRVKLRDSHGGDMDEWPLDLRVREFPREPEAMPA